MKRPIIILSLFACLSVSCRIGEIEKQDVPAKEDSPITFTSQTISETKAVENDPDLLDYLKDNTASGGKGFGVYAYYTGQDDFTTAAEADGLVLNDRHVWWGKDKTYDYDHDNDSWAWHNLTTDAWLYYGADPLITGQTLYKEYWPTSDDEKISFFAYAPYGVYNSTNGTAGTGNRVSVDNSNANGPQIPYSPLASGSLTSTQLANQVDLMWGTDIDGDPYRNISRPEDSTVPFFFRHALSKVRFTIKAPNEPDSPTDQTLTQLISEATNYYSGELTTKKTFYAIESIEVSGFQGGGTLYLNNNVSGQPLWVIASGESREYTLDQLFSSADFTYVRNGVYNTATLANNQTNYNTLLTKISNPYRSTSATNWSTSGTNASTYSTALNNFSTIGTDALSLMGSDYIYTIPGEVNLTVTIKYHKLTAYVYRYRTSYYTSNNRNNSYAGISIYDGADGATQADINNHRGFTKSGSMTTLFEAGRQYDVTISLGDTPWVELLVVPQQWDLKQPTYDFNKEENPVIEHLDYVDIVGESGGVVTINNSVGHFKFRLGEGRYILWQASLVSLSGDANFAFCDENGVFYEEYYQAGDGTTRSRPAATIRDVIDPNVTNHIYVRAIDVTDGEPHSAKLRIYGFDSQTAAGDPGNSKVLLYLIHPNFGVNEWTIYQNPNM